MEVAELARRWADAWERAWAAKDVEAIVGLYAADASYRAATASSSTASAPAGPPPTWAGRAGDLLPDGPTAASSATAARLPW